MAAEHQPKSFMSPEPGSFVLPDLIRQTVSYRKRTYTQAELMELALNPKSGIGKFPGRLSQRATPEEQVQVDEICRQMRQDCEELLRQHGKLEKAGLAGEFLILLGKLGYAALSPIRRSGLSQRELEEYRLLKTEISTEDGKPVKIQLRSSGTVDPSQSSRIFIIIPEISDERGWLMLFKDHGELWELGIGMRLPTDRPVRKANLFDAREFGQVVDLLKQQFPIDPQPQDKTL